MTRSYDPHAVHELVRAFALRLPEAAEEFPWGESVVKVNKKIFVFLGAGDDGLPPSITVKLRDGESHAHALTVPGAMPAGYGLGKAGWVRIPLADDAPEASLLCDWIEESYRTIAPRRLVKTLENEGL